MPTELRLNGSCDAVVVGGGTAGCLIAGLLARLSPDARVMLIDAGRGTQDDGVLDRSPIRPVTPGVLPLHRPEGYEIAPAPTVIGGSSLLHGGIALRGTRADHESWHAGAGDAWSPQAVESLFDRLESGTDETTAGIPLRTTELNRLPAAYQTFHAYCARVFGEAADLNRPFAYGVGMVPSAQTDNRIATTYRRHVLPRPANLVVRTGTVVDHVRVRRDRVDRITLRRPGHDDTEYVRAGLVVLAAGAIGTAEILLRSGIGSARAAKAQGIRAVLDLPAVGARLRDHTVLWWEASVRDTDPRQPWPWHAVLCRTVPHDDRLPGCHFELFHDFRLFTRHLWKRRVVLTCTQLRDIRPGRVRLRGTGSRPCVHVEAATPRDGATVRRYTEHVGTLPHEEEFRALGLRGLRAVPCPTHDRGGDTADPMAKVRSAYHFHGTCPMGTDPARAVVGPDLRVFGTDNLYVADASVLPAQFGANTHHATRAVALRATDTLSGALA